MSYEEIEKEIEDEIRRRRVYVALDDSGVYHQKRATNPSLAWCGLDVSNSRFQRVAKDATSKTFCGNCRNVGGRTNEGSLIWDRELEAEGWYDVQYDERLQEFQGGSVMPIQLSGINDLSEITEPDNEVVRVESVERAGGGNIESDARRRAIDVLQRLQGFELFLDPEDAKRLYERNIHALTQEFTVATAELEARLAEARAEIESATANWRNTSRTAWERNGRLEKQLAESEARLKSAEGERDTAKRLRNEEESIRIEQEADFLAAVKNLRLQVTAAEARAGKLKAALEKVEYVPHSAEGMEGFFYCPWCGDEPHADDCARQAALSAEDKG